MFWRSGKCTVRAGYHSDGTLFFSGHDLAYFGNPGEEYEYWITVARSDFDRVRAALGAGSDEDVVDAVCARVESIMPGGETAWLREHGIDYEFSSWHSAT